MTSGDSIVIYPEIVDGNPLGGKRVVRWLLNKPGFFSTRAEFADDDLVFYFNPAFADERPRGTAGGELRLFALLPEYDITGTTGNRAGYCHMIRKGADRTHDQHPHDSKQLDGLPHADVAAAFRKHKYFITYDAHTMYTIYAALIGCVPVIIPIPGVDIDHWEPIVANRYGRAYGFENIPWAIETLPQLRAQISDSEVEGRRSVERFVKCCWAHFAR
jgi:hypothetical protein